MPYEDQDNDSIAGAIIIASIIAFLIAVIVNIYRHASNTITTTSDITSNIAGMNLSSISSISITQQDIIFIVCTALLLLGLFTGLLIGYTKGAIDATKNSATIKDKIDKILENEQENDNE